LTRFLDVSELFVRPEYCITLILIVHDADSLHIQYKWKYGGN